MEELRNLIKVHNVRRWKIFKLICELFQSLSRTPRASHTVFNMRAPVIYFHSSSWILTSFSRLFDNVGGQQLEAQGRHFHADYPESCSCLSWHGVPAELENRPWTNKKRNGWHCPRAGRNIYPHLARIQNKPQRWLRNTARCCIGRVFSMSPW